MRKIIIILENAFLKFERFFAGIGFCVKIFLKKALLRGWNFFPAKGLLGHQIIENFLQF
jgi:hypothetical protein